jgi:hypothetical protein
VALAGCRGAFAEEKRKPAMDMLCETGKSDAIHSRNGDVVAWRTGQNGVCWIRGRGRILSREGVNAIPMDDESGKLRFTPDERALTWRVTTGTVTFDLATGAHAIIPDEPSRERR